MTLKPSKTADAIKVFLVFISVLSDAYARHPGEASNQRRASQLLRHVLASGEQRVIEK